MPKKPKNQSAETPHNPPLLIPFIEHLPPKASYITAVTPQMIAVEQELFEKAQHEPINKFGRTLFGDIDPGSLGLLSAQNFYPEVLKNIALPVQTSESGVTDEVIQTNVMEHLLPQLKAGGNIFIVESCAGITTPLQIAFKKITGVELKASSIRQHVGLKQTTLSFERDLTTSMLEDAEVHPREYMYFRWVKQILLSLVQEPTDENDGAVYLSGCYVPLMAMAIALSEIKTEFPDTTLSNLTDKIVILPSPWAHASYGEDFVGDIRGITREDVAAVIVSAYLKPRVSDLYLENLEAELDQYSRIPNPEQLPFYLEGAGLGAFTNMLNKEQLCDLLREANRILLRSKSMSDNPKDQVPQEPESMNALPKVSVSKPTSNGTPNRPTNLMKAIQEANLRLENANFDIYNLNRQIDPHSLIAASWLFFATGAAVQQLSIVRNISENAEELQRAAAYLEMARVQVKNLDKKEVEATRGVIPVLSYGEVGAMIHDWSIDFSIGHAIALIASRPADNTKDSYVEQLDMAMTIISAARDRS